MISKVSVAAIAIGIANFIFLYYCWGHNPAHSPLLNWIPTFDISVTARKIIFYSFDFIAHILLSFPAAYALYKLQPRNMSLYLALAVAPSFLWLNSSLITHPITVIDLVPWHITLTNIIYGLAIIPIAVFIVHNISECVNSYRLHKLLKKISK